MEGPPRGLPGYVIVRWYVGCVGSETDGYELSRLMEDVCSYTKVDNPLPWTFRISSGVSQGIDKSVVQSDWEFLRIGVDGRR